MITINIAKDELAKQLFPSLIEEQYVNLTREIISYVKLESQKKSAFNKIKESDNKTIKAHSAKEYKALVNRIDILSRVLNILRDMLDNNINLDVIENANIVLSKIYSDEQIDLIQSYINMRKSIYKFIEYMGYLLIKKELLTNMDNIAFMISLKALKVFDLDNILLNQKDLGEITKLMNTVSKFIQNREIDLISLREIMVLNDNPDYFSIIDALNNNYVKTISPNSK